MSDDVPITQHALFTSIRAVDDFRESLMTVEEHELVNKLGSLMSDFRNITGEEKTRAADMGEVCDHVHALQNMVLAQAAGRAFGYRLLGETID